MKNVFKKAMITMCSAVMLMGISAVGVNAAQGTVGEFTVERNYKNGNVVRIISYTGSGGDIVLPEKVTIAEQEYTIESVGEGFANNAKITSVQIPEGYKTIEASVFEGCTNLKSVTIPGSMTMISASAFEDCPKLETVTFADDTASSLSVKNDIFANCTSLTSINLPKRLSSASNNFLRGCTALTSISIADGAEKFTVSDNVLYDVSEDTTAAIVAYPFGKTETEFTIPAEINGKAVTSTAMHVFRNNPILKKVTVPATVTSLGGYTFNGMKAIEEIILEHETAPKFGSSVCTEMNSGSRIIVKNEDVAKAFESTSSYTKYYTPENTTITVAGAEPEVKTVSAAVSIEEDKITGGKAVYNIYLDSAENVSTVILKVSFDLSKVDKGEIIANDKFTSGTSTWKEENGKLVLKAYMGITGNVTGFTSTAKTKLAQISVPLKDSAKGNITAEILSALAAGVVSEDESAMNGTVTVGEASANIFVPSYDVNDDGTVDIIDITEAQRYYRSTSTDANWETAKAMDVNGDNKVDIEDYIAIFNNLSDF